MRLLISLFLALVAYVIVGATLALAAQAIWADALPVSGHPPDHLGALLVDLGVQAIACLAAGVCAMQPEGLRLRSVLGAVGLPLLAVTALATVAAWSLMPDWYDMATLLLTLPFFALGAAWRQAIRAASTAVSYRAT